uniref:Uncharacterized protein n=1 Tax=Panagrellus redivivus TaxID=6233 RepID=A0A7E4VCA2_PANRE
MKPKGVGNMNKLIMIWGSKTLRGSMRIKDQTRARRSQQWHEMCPEAEAGRFFKPSTRRDSDRRHTARGSPPKMVDHT